MTELSDGRVEVRLTTGGGRLAATLSIVDASDDPTTVPLLGVT